MNEPLTSKQSDIDLHLIALKYDICDKSADCKPCQGIREKSIEIIERLRLQVYALTNANKSLADRADGQPPNRHTDEPKAASDDPARCVTCGRSFYEDAEPPLTAETFYAAMGAAKRDAEPPVASPKFKVGDRVEWSNEYDVGSYHGTILEVHTEARYAIECQEIRGVLMHSEKDLRLSPTKSASPALGFGIPFLVDMVKERMQVGESQEEAIAKVAEHSELRSEAISALRAAFETNERRQCGCRTPGCTGCGEFP